MVLALGMVLIGCSTEPAKTDIVMISGPLEGTLNNPAGYILADNVSVAVDKTLTLESSLTIPTGKSLSIAGTWFEDGYVGGVLCIEANGSVTIGGTLEVGDAGAFEGGTGTVRTEGTGKIRNRATVRDYTVSSAVSAGNMGAMGRLAWDCKIPEWNPTVAITPVDGTGVVATNVTQINEGAVIEGAAGTTSGFTTGANNGIVITISIDENGTLKTSASRAVTNGVVAETKEVSISAGKISEDGVTTDSPEFTLSLTIPKVDN
jgi:hypothetical protein